MLQSDQAFFHHLINEGRLRLALHSGLIQLPLVFWNNGLQAQRVISDGGALYVVPANLQVICSLCQRTKRDQEAGYLRSELVLTIDAACPFCSPAAIEAQNGSAYAIKDKYPVTPDHMLIIPYRHQPDFFSMTAQERRDAEDLILYLRNSLLEKDSSILGFNIGCNNGEAAGQTIMHMHWHLIPRRTGDTPRPRGGVRGAIPSRMSY